MLYLIYILALIIFALVGYAILQIRLFGITVKDFWKFIEANQTLDKLYEYSEAIFNAFDKMPNELWEDEYDKYRAILDKYKEIKMKRWSETKV